MGAKQAKIRTEERRKEIEREDLVKDEKTIEEAIAVAVEDGV